jgi:hypothetical protein
MYSAPSLLIAEDDNQIGPPVSYFHTRVPELLTAYTHLSKDAKYTVPSLPIAGDEWTP